MAARDTPKPGEEGGVGCPPIHGRFKKGQSGNPKGRPPKSHDFKKLVEAELDVPISLSENGKRVRLSKRELIAKKLVNDAARGEDKALGHLLKLIGGPSEPDNPTVSVDPAEIARFAMRYLRVPPIENAKDDEQPSRGGARKEKRDAEEAGEQ